MRRLALTVLVLLLVAPPARAKSPAEFCAVRWPDDFDMQEVCVRKQTAAAQRIEAWTTAHKATAAASTIRATCSKRWEDDADMMDVCIQKQWAAYQRLHPN